MTTPRGLLNGATDVRYGTLNDDFETEHTWLSKRGLFWEAATADCASSNDDDVSKYLSTVIESLRTFIESDELFDRKELRAAIVAASTDKEQMSVLFGGKSVGKTTTLRLLSEEFLKGEEVVVLYVSGRKHPSNFSLGIKTAFETLDARLSMSSTDWSVVGKAVGKSITDTVDKLNPAALKAAPNAEAQLSVAAVSCGSFILDSLLEEEESENLYIDLFIAYAQQAKKKPFLIIDEANEIIKEGAETSDPLLLKIIAETKEAKNLSVLLASSDHSYPSKLKKRGLQNAFTRIIFADEFPPKEMRALLTKCGMGRHLIDMCMSVCGGHLLKVLNTVKSLMLAKESFTAREIVSAEETLIKFSKIKTKSDIEQLKLLGMMKALAVDGCIRVNFEDEYIDFLAEMEIASQVDLKVARKRLPGLDAKKMIGAFLVPSSQTLRFALRKYCAHSAN